jgi:hypothetical protein
VRDPGGIAEQRIAIHRPQFGEHRIDDGITGSAGHEAVVIQAIMALEFNACKISRLGRRGHDVRIVVVSDLVHRCDCISRCHRRGTGFRWCVARAAGQEKCQNCEALAASL